MLRQKIEGGEVESPGENSIGTSTGSEKINKKEVKKKLQHFRDRQKLVNYCIICETMVRNLQLYRNYIIKTNEQQK